MLLDILFGSSPRDAVISLLLALPVIMFALSIHEAAHGYVAYKCGDMTAKAMGRLSINPLRHLDPIGFLAMMLVGFGWAKPVPINTRNFRDPKRGMALSAAAGPLSNLIMGLLSTVLLGFFIALNAYLSFKGAPAIVLNILDYVYILFSLSAQINLVFAFFNLIPVPPFDGSRLAFAFLPPRTYFGIMRYERQILIGVLLAMTACSYLFDFSPFGWLAGKVINGIAQPVANGFWKIFLKALIS